MSAGKAGRGAPSWWVRRLRRPVVAVAVPPTGRVELDGDQLEAPACSRPRREAGWAMQLHGVVRASPRAPFVSLAAGVAVPRQGWAPGVVRAAVREPSACLLFTFPSPPDA
ncbi:hypothetical protein, partial [Amycolatopsis palatopharyngis]|uniref:hypothetical protein n=1 Tax=Amycolatopsis palatopharyngis TaxID=187982 RepID=UPI001B87BAE7